MRRPVTDEQLAQVTVSDAEVERHVRLCTKIADQITKVIGDSGPAVGGALMYAAASTATAIGLPREDCMRLVADACATFRAEARPIAVPTHAERKDIPALGKRLHYITVAALRSEGGDVFEMVHAQWTCAVSLLRWNGYDDALCQSIATAALDDAESALAEIAAKKGPAS